MPEGPIAFIGAGNMASSLIGGLRQKGWPAPIYAVEPDDARRAAVTANHGVEAMPTPDDRVGGAELIVLAVKPGVVAQALAELQPVLADPPAPILSVAAGVRAADVRRWSGRPTPVVRAMPNTPALLLAGASALWAEPSVTTEQRIRAAQVLEAVGLAVWVANEAQLDAVTALSGSGPAYFFALIEAMEAAAVDLGLDAAVARQLACQTAYGAATMVTQSPETPTRLRERVTSPGGTTAAALEVLSTRGLAAMIADAMGAARARAEAISNEVAAAVLPAASADDEQGDPSR